jgi:hypothetical protein
MASQTTSNNRRLAANRANAQKSTGPKTTAGKIKSSLNAVKTGLTGRTILLSGEEAARYRAHVESFHRELQPVGELETNLVQSLADTQWRLNRIPGLESGLLALGRKRCAPDLFAEEKNPDVRETLLEAHVFNTEATALKNLYLQESRLRRQYANDMKELDKLRAERAALAQKEKSQRAWERQKESIRNCDCDKCRNLARHLFPQSHRNQSVEDEMASNFQIDSEAVESTPDNELEDQ